MEEPKFSKLFMQHPRFEHDGGSDNASHYIQAKEFERAVREIIRDELDRQARNALRETNGYS